eukprot:TRINITY_DN8597_c0_g1_i1.p1 TRINITY_DN8597_c0_g1~~TRINITY_DN8597_c0_g1_i1.p1  ORF type:complete len:121 (-),score=15.90 TRINITY_DN8597_c0_g1_i1:16-378(-)
MKPILYTILSILILFSIPSYAIQCSDAKTKEECVKIPSILNGIDACLWCGIATMDGQFGPGNCSAINDCGGLFCEGDAFACATAPMWPIYVIGGGVAVFVGLIVVLVNVLCKKQKYANVK